MSSICPPLHLIAFIYYNIFPELNILFNFNHSTTLILSLHQLSCPHCYSWLIHIVLFSSLHYRCQQGGDSLEDVFPGLNHKLPTPPLNMGYRKILFPIPVPEITRVWDSLSLIFFYHVFILSYYINTSNIYTYIYFLIIYFFLI